MNKITQDLTLYNQKQFDNQILNLTKILVDSLNKKELEQNTSWKPADDNEKGSIFFLEHFLTETRTEKESQILQICKGFRILQSLRSGGSAHLKSSEYNKLIHKQLGLTDFDVKEAWNKLIEHIINSMKALGSLLN